jgi:glucose-6-phosphate 1-epimerase
MNIDDLNRDFSFDELTFTTGQGDLILAEIKNKFATASISLMGAHLLSFQPKNSEPVLWMSPASNFAEGKPIRGGIPICFPWFADHPSDKTKPLHGFVRLKYWNVSETESLEDGRTKIVLSISDDSSSHEIWPFSFECTFTVIVGSECDIELKITNTDSGTINFTDALHTYFFAGNAADITIKGLDKTDYIDKTDNFIRKTQHGDIAITSETNRIYCDTAAESVIIDPVLKRKIHVRKKGSNTTVVWNPWLKASDMKDMTPESYQNMVCVETVNAVDDNIELSPGSEHVIAATISIE